MGNSISGQTIEEEGIWETSRVIFLGFHIIFEHVSRYFQVKNHLLNLKIRPVSTRTPSSWSYRLFLVKNRFLRRIKFRELLIRWKQFIWTKIAYFALGCTCPAFIARQTRLTRLKCIRAWRTFGSNGSIGSHKLDGSDWVKKLNSSKLFLNEK